MITVALRYQIGNQLFQYACGRNLALKKHTSLRLDLSQYEQKNVQHHYLLHRFNIPEDIITSSQSEDSDEQQIVYKEISNSFDNKIFLLPGDNIRLQGLFQSEKNFKENEPIIRQEITFKPFFYDEETQKLEEEIRGSNSVSIHVRRGDYVSKYRFDVLTQDYYKKAVAYFQERVCAPRFFIFSDDIDYCYQNLNLPQSRYVNLVNSAADPLNDLRLMTLCKHHIIANSSFSWWGAWLNNNPHKMVIAPNIWFRVLEKGGHGKNIPDYWTKEVPIEDKIPESWIKLDVQ